ncbi:MAG TPA: hypothetical protein VMF59_14090, partial [Bacteroidota bacterium]|nr:hypothetical protein [Bacteroidota bacterium]
FKLGSHSVWGGGGKNNVEMSLNPAPAWTLDIEVGASQLDADLSPYAMDQVRVKTGVSDVRLKLGDRAEESRVRIEAGVSSIVVKVPESAGCEISSESGLSSKSFEGFSNARGGTYRTANFDSAGKKIFLSFHAGVSSLKVVRY